MNKKIIPKSVNYEHMIKDTKVKAIIEAQMKMLKLLLIL